MLDTFDHAEALERHDLQYFEMFGNRGVYFKGWSAVTKHRTPWVMGAAKLAALDATSGSSTMATTTTARPTTSSPNTRTCWPRCNGCG